MEERINDVERQHYYAGYLKELIEAVVDDGIPIGGYMAWSLLEYVSSSFLPHSSVTGDDKWAIR